MSQPLPAAPVAARAGLLEQITELDTRFWIVNVMEMFERLAYYGVRGVIAIYMVLPLESGGPEFTHVQKGAIFAAWAAMQSLLPMFTGGFADRYGHKRTIAAAIVIKMAGYLCMAHFKSYPLFFMGCMLLAAGTAIFKPGVQGTLAASLKKTNSSVGWGIFYQLVNIGGFLGPVLAGVLRMMDWVYVFYACALIVSVNFMWLPFYRDPTQDAGDAAAASGQDAGDALVEEEAAQRRSWASLAASVSAQTARRWGMGTALVALAWFSGTFGLGTLASMLSGPDLTVIFTPQPWHPLALGVAAGGSALALLAGFAAWNSGLRRLGDLALWSVLALTVLCLGLGLHTNPSGALAVIGDARGGMWTAVATLASAGVYLVPIGSLLGAALLLFARKKDHFDQGGLDPMSIFVVSIAGLFQARVLWFCLVFSGFWLMFNQVFDLLPNVMDDWVDSSGIILTLGHAFSNPAVPWGLAGVLGLLYGFVCAVIVLLAMRPDHRPTDQVSRPAWVVVAIGVALASWFPLQPLTQEASAALSTGVSTGVLAGTPVPHLVSLMIPLAVGLAVAAVSSAVRLPARVVAIVTALMAALGTSWSIGHLLSGSAGSLVELANAGQQVNPEWLINLNPGLIVFTMIFFAWLSGMVRPLTSIIVGMAVATLGSVMAGTATIGWICLGGILVFSVGEMLSSPKKMEYLAGLAKKGQEGLFMGYANVPVAIGWIAGSIFAGNRYEVAGDKANLARRYLVETQGWTQQAADGLPRSEVVTTLGHELGQTAADVQHLLFSTYHPERLWLDIGAVGVASIIGMIIYDFVLRRADAKAQRDPAA